MTPQNSEYLEVPVKDGTKFLIDWDDFIEYGHLPWHATRGRVVCMLSEQAADGVKRWRVVSLPRLIVGLEPGNALEADHINGDPRDNRRINLRVGTHEENMWNRRMHKNNTSGFKGVGQIGPDRWVAGVMAGGRFHYLGVFGSPEKAHQAYCEAAAWLHGEFANFGENRSQEFSLPARPAEIPYILATTAGNRRTLRARAGLGVWGTTPGPRPFFVANHPIFS